MSGRSQALETSLGINNLQLFGVPSLIDHWAWGQLFQYGRFLGSAVRPTEWAYSRITCDADVRIRVYRSPDVKDTLAASPDHSR